MENLKNKVTPQATVEIVATVAFITEAHAGQEYGNMPYFFHPIDVACTVEDARVTEYLAALLHDVIEDTKYSADDLRTRFSNEVVEMVELLTKDDTLNYRANIERIINSGNVGAMKVKLADNRVNMRGDKSDMRPERREKLVTRYTMSIEMLEAALEGK